MITAALQFNIESSCRPDSLREMMRGMMHVRLEHFPILDRRCCCSTASNLRVGSNALCTWEPVCRWQGDVVMHDEGPAIVGFLGARPETHRPRPPSQLFCDARWRTHHLCHCLTTPPLWLITQPFRVSSPYDLDCTTIGKREF